MRMIGDESYYSWLKAKSRNFGVKYKVDSEDLLQEFFLSVMEGKTAKFEHVFFGAIRSEYCRGVTGKHDAVDFSYDETLLVRVADTRRKLSDPDFIEYLCDLRSITSETEYKLVCMYLGGFDQGEIYEKAKDVSRRDLAALWKRLGLRRGIA